MKTAERILLTALTLFNEHGESAVTSVDIAMELDISPGNLYYHYKGKEVIIDKLMALHKKQMLSLLREELLADLSSEDCFYYLYMVIEKIHLFRFFYRSQADFAEKYLHASKIQRHIIHSLEKQIDRLLAQLASSHALNLQNSERPLLKELLTLILTQSGHFDQSLHSMDDTAQQFHGLSLIMAALLPRLTLPADKLAALQQSIHSHSVANLSPVRPVSENT